TSFSNIPGLPPAPFLPSAPVSTPPWPGSRTTVKAAVVGFAGGAATGGGAVEGNGDSGVEPGAAGGAPAGPGEGGVGGTRRAAVRLATVTTGGATPLPAASMPMGAGVADFTGGADVLEATGKDGGFGALRSGSTTLVTKSSGTYRSPLICRAARDRTIRSAP